MAIVKLTHAQRGVGDIELRNSSGDRKWISGKLYVSSDTLPSGYVKYGVIVAFEKSGAALLVAFDEAPTGTLFCTATGVTLPTVVSDNISTSWGTALNGTKSTYKCMNVAQVVNRCKTGAINTTPTTHPSDAYYNSASGPNTEAVFLANEEAVNIYGTYKAYIAQTRPVLKGSASGVFSKRCGKTNTKALAEDTDNTYPAAVYCHTYKVAGSRDVDGTWWLPDMYELAMMMADENYDLHHAVSDISSSVHYWSCVAYSASAAWNYINYGMSDYHTFTLTWLRARPVTLSV